ncbi:MAG TPA: hypothetical protein VK506_16205 [Conexibacter sp.]|nr:hypothetical protein [Conexibacter sp.]
MRRLHDLAGNFLFELDDAYRLEPLPRSPEVASGLTARIHDPAWALTRQWQLGEFAGQDAGSPVLVELAGHSTLLSHWRPALDDTQPWISYHPRQGPLDTLIEAEERPAEVDLRTRVEGGAHFVRLLEEARLAARLPELLAACGFPDPLEPPEPEPVDGEPARRVPPEDGLDLVALLAVKVPDAQRLARAIDDRALPVAGVDAVAARWRRWWAELAPDPGPDTFDEHRFEHAAAFSVAERVLRAEQYLGDGLDWFSVDVDPAGRPQPAGAVHRFRREALASPVRFGGLPADRFWEMEDAQVDLGSTDVSTLDTGRLLLIAFAEVYGNDWFLLPLEVPAGSLTVIEQLRVTDTFGRQQTIERAGREDPAWSMFTLHGADDGLLVMPSERGVVGEPLERIALARDELANVAWAIEGEYTDRRGRLVSRRDRWPAIEPEPPPPGELPAYAVQTIVPDYWLPLVPHMVGVGEIQFALVPLLQPGADSRPLGRLLTPGTWLHEEEVPREGASVTRRPVLARWFDGSTHAWTRREKNPGAGESSSGLAFDIVRPSEPWP